MTLPRLTAPEPRDQLLRVVLALLAATALGAAGMVTQWCCRVPDDDDENHDRGDGEGDGAPAG